MLSKSITVISPSRTYVAVCNNINFDGNYFRKFYLPEKDPLYEAPMENNASLASWYFLNRVSSTACIDGVVTWEDFQNVKDESQVRTELEKALANF